MPYLIGTRAKPKMKPHTPIKNKAVLNEAHNNPKYKSARPKIFTIHGKMEKIRKFGSKLRMSNPMPLAFFLQIMSNNAEYFMSENSPKNCQNKLNMSVNGKGKSQPTTLSADGFVS